MRNTDKALLGEETGSSFSEPEQAHDQPKLSGQKIFKTLLNRESQQYKTAGDVTAEMLGILNRKHSGLTGEQCTNKFNYPEEEKEQT